MSKKIFWKNDGEDLSKLQNTSHQKLVASNLSDVYLNSEKSVKKQSKSAANIISQFDENNIFVKDWVGKKSFQESEFNYNTVVSHAKSKSETLYRGFYWRYKKRTNKKHRKSKWNEQTIREFALTCSYKAEFKRKYLQAYRKAQELGIFDEVTSHMKRPKAQNQYTKKLKKYLDN